MMHALAIGHAGPAAAAAVNGLWNAGYRSIMRVEDAFEAPAVLASFHPDLILVLPDAAEADSVAVLRDIAKKAKAPVVVARADVESALDCLGPTIADDRTLWSRPRRSAGLQLAA